MKHILAAGLIAIMVNFLAYAPAEFYHVWIWFGLVGAWIKMRGRGEAG